MQLRAAGKRKNVKFSIKQLMMASVTHPSLKCLFFSVQKVTYWYLLHTKFWLMNKQGASCLWHISSWIDHMITLYTYHLAHSLQTASFVHWWLQLVSQCILHWIEFWVGKVNKLLLPALKCLPSGGQVMVKKSKGLVAPLSFTLCSSSTGSLSLSSFTCSRQYGTFCHDLNASTCCLSIWYEQCNNFDVRSYNQ